MEYQNDARVQIGQKLRAARKKAGMKQREVAEKAGITAVFYGNLERGERAAKTVTLAKICSVLGTTLEEVTAATNRDISYYQYINQMPKRTPILRDSGPRFQPFSYQASDEPSYISMLQQTSDAAEEVEDEQDAPNTLGLPELIESVYTDSAEEQKKLAKALDDVIQSASKLRELLQSSINISGEELEDENDIPNQ